MKIPIAAAFLCRRCSLCQPRAGRTMHGRVDGASVNAANGNVSSVEQEAAMVSFYACQICHLGRQGLAAPLADLQCCRSLCVSGRHAGSDAYMTLGSHLVCSSSLVHTQRSRFGRQRASQGRCYLRLSLPFTPLHLHPYRIAAISPAEGLTEDLQLRRPILVPQEELSLCRPASGECCSVDGSGEDTSEGAQLRRPTPLPPPASAPQPSDPGSAGISTEELPQLRRPAAASQPQDPSEPKHRASLWHHDRAAYTYDRGGWPADGTRRGMLETDVGIRCWTDSLPGFTGILKQR